MNTSLHELTARQAEVAQDYFGQYDPVLAAILMDESPNTALGMEMSCRQMADRVRQLMDWETLDLFGVHDFEDAYKNGSAPIVLVNGMIALLRFRVFQRAESEGIGLPGFNDRMMAHSTRWQTMLFEKWNANRSGTTPTHKWNN